MCWLPSTNGSRIVLVIPLKGHIELLILFYCEDANSEYLSPLGNVQQSKC